MRVKRAREFAEDSDEGDLETTLSDRSKKKREESERS